MTDYTELLKRLDDFSNKGYGDSWPFYVFEQSAAAIRELQAKIDTPYNCGLDDALEWMRQAESEKLKIDNADLEEAYNECIIGNSNAYTRGLEDAVKVYKTGPKREDGTAWPYIEKFQTAINALKPKE